MIALARRKLGSFRRLPGAERREVLRLAPAALALSLGLGPRSLAPLAKLLGVGLSVGGQASPRSLERAELVTAARAVRLWSRNLPGLGTCLPQALLLAHALRGHGASVKIGVARDESFFKAHAWVELDGRRLEVEASSEDASLDFVALRRAA